MEQLCLLVAAQCLAICLALPGLRLLVRQYLLQYCLAQLLVHVIAGTSQAMYAIKYVTTFLCALRMVMLTEKAFLPFAAQNFPAATPVQLSAELQTASGHLAHGRPSQLALTPVMLTDLLCLHMDVGD